MVDKRERSYGPSLLPEVLRAIDSQKADTVEGLASWLGTSPGLVRGMMEDLMRMGYLRSADAVCPVACTGCPSRDACAGLPQMWTLTDRGRRASRRHEDA